MLYCTIRPLAIELAILKLQEQVLLLFPTSTFKLGAALLWPEVFRQLLESWMVEDRHPPLPFPSCTLKTGSDSFSRGGENQLLDERKCISTTGSDLINIQTESMSLERSFGMEDISEQGKGSKVFFFVFLKEHPPYHSPPQYVWILKCWFHYLHMPIRLAT